jgi:hypothetical protein
VVNPQVPVCLDPQESLANATKVAACVVWTPWAHYLGGYQDRLLGGPLGLPDLCRTVPDSVRRKDYGGEVLE